MTLETLSTNQSHGGTQGVYRHASRETGTEMTFSVFVPPQAEAARPARSSGISPGLTCTHANVTEKGEYRAACAELGLIFVAPDTSPRGPDVPDDEAYDFGQGAGFYVDATEAPFDAQLPDVFLRRRGAAGADRRELPGRHGAAGDHRPFDGRPRRAHPRAAQSRPLPERLRLRPDRRAQPGAVGREGAGPLSRRGPRRLAARTTRWR